MEQFILLDLAISLDVALACLGEQGAVVIERLSFPLDALDVANRLFGCNLLGRLRAIDHFDSNPGLQWQRCGSCVCSLARAVSPRCETKWRVWSLT